MHLASKPTYLTANRWQVKNTCWKEGEWKGMIKEKRGKSGSGRERTSRWRQPGNWEGIGKKGKEKRGKERNRQLRLKWGKEGLEKV